MSFGQSSQVYEKVFQIFLFSLALHFRVFGMYTESFKYFSVNLGIVHEYKKLRNTKTVFRKFIDLVIKDIAQVFPKLAK